VKGQKSTPVVLWMPKAISEDNEGVRREKRILIFKMYHVFNFEQITGLKVSEKDEEKLKEARAKELIEAEEIIKLYTDKPPVEFGGDRAYYSPKHDKVQMPTKKQFNSTEEYYSTLFHEFAHSTGHETRLQRKGVAEFDAFGTTQYSEEELIAEFTSAFLCSKAQIDNTIANSTAYIQGWMKAFKENPKMIISCASKAQTACDYICGKRYSKASSETPEEASAQA
jgi:antirestriction protein ArdC